MINVYEMLGKAFGIDEYELEEMLSENFGMYFRGLTIYVQAGKKKTRIGVNDIIYYYAYEARNLSSGCRTLAGIVGDWRNIDSLAKQCLEIYKVLKRDELQKIAHKFGMELKKN